MSHIHILSENLRNQIAAGEVVERPASVIKELVENSIDAGATSIKIDLENAGIKHIKIRDNGSGMSPEDAKLSVQRYATSKIKTKNDLFHISSYGFRGEALSSIASVSYFILETKTKEAQVGTKIEIQAGYNQTEDACAMTTGTNIEIHDLFQNIPARKKFLKTERTEFRYCLEIIENIALCFPKINFELIHNKKTIATYLADTSEKRIQQIIGSDVFSRCIPFSSDFPGVTFRGFVTKPGESFSSRRTQKIFVNNRCVQDRTIQGAIKEGYHSLVEKGSFPAYCLFIDIDPDLVDVNVHPRKTEVRFLRPQELFSFLSRGLQQCFLQKHQDIQMPETTTQIRQEHPRETYSQNNFSSYTTPKAFVPTNSRDTINNAMNFTKNILQPTQNQTEHHQELNLHESIADPLHGYKIVGQTLKKFIILEKNNTVTFLDQHAVHERARYDTLMQNYKNKTKLSQHLLISEIFECSTQEKLSIEECQKTLQDFGFELEDFGNNTIKINAIPQDISLENIKDTILETCQELSLSGQSRKPEQAAEIALTFLSCRGAIKFGDQLSPTELESVVTLWLKHAKGITCPHGRPLGFEMPSKELEKKVGR